MRYYAHYGHKDFVLALGYRGDMIRDYFLRYQECMSNDFTLSEGGKSVEVHGRDIEDWKITFVDTGLHSNIGQRLLRVRRYLDPGETFLANYADGLSDLPLDEMLADFARKRLVASFAAVRSWQSFHFVEADPDGLVTALGPMRGEALLINGGFFAMRPEIFDYLHEGEELVEQPFARLLEKRLLGAWRHLGFWQAMDTFKDKITLDRMEARGDCPWMVWKNGKGVAG
jgi:glucose-1-phosphate cytidylyltransferase